MTSKDIPEDVREAFERAAKALFAWDSIGGDEPTVIVHGSPTLISMVATLADTYKEMMPADLYWRMVHHANCSPRRRVQASKLSHDSSYATEQNVCWNGCETRDPSPKCTRPQGDH